MGTISGGKTLEVRKLRFFSSIRIKFALTYFSVIAVVLILMNTYFLLAIRDMIFSSKQVSVQNMASYVATKLEETFDTIGADDDIQRIMVQLDVSGITHLVITDAEGIAIYDPTESYLRSDHQADNIVRALSGNDVFFARFSDSSFSSSAFTPIMSKGAVIGAVYVHDEDPEQGAILIDMQMELRNISITVAIFSVVMIMLIILSLMRRVSSIIKAIKSVREGEYSYHIAMRGYDELALLGDEFNSLTNRLRETDEVRRRFVADASHELKTPLASIRLLSDSILQNEGIERETVQEFISDIGSEAERLARTTEKLMTLTRLDSHIPDVMTRVDMKGSVVATLRILRPLADSRRLTIDPELEEGCFIFASEDSIHQVVFNLVENAVKYNKPGGRVTVRLAIEGENVVLTVDDTGVGVPEEDLPYIFDRFYRVDKARSREAGGSGLGLSIVRTTVSELDGKVTAARRAGGGMRFQVKFALYSEPK